MIHFEYVIAGAFTGFVVGVTGVGGGALMTPILLLFFGVNPSTAIATDLWFAAITKFAGASMHHRAGNVDWQVTKRLWTGSIPIAVLTLMLVTIGGPFFKLPWLATLIGLLIVFTGLGLLLAPWLSNHARLRRVSNPLAFKRAQPILTVLAGALLGGCVALTSIGAGALGSVLLLYLYPLRMTPHRLIATDLVHAIPLAAVAGAGYLFAGLVDGEMLLSLLVGSIPAILLGSYLAGRMRGRYIQYALALLLIVAGTKIVM